MFYVLYIKYKIAIFMIKKKLKKWLSKYFPRLFFTLIFLMYSTLLLADEKAITLNFKNQIYASGNEFPVMYLSGSSLPVMYLSGSSLPVMQLANNTLYKDGSDGKIIEHVAVPDTRYTTGMLCSESDPNFSHTYRYNEKIPYCTRDVNGIEKSEVAKEYNTPRSDWRNYEFDHLIPLSIGGSDDIRNIWPQPLNQAKLKDRVEDEVFLAMKKGQLTQDQAISKLINWFCDPCHDIYGKNICISIKVTGLNLTECTSFSQEIFKKLGISVTIQFKN